MRTIDATLQAALDSGSFNAYIKARIRRASPAYEQTVNVLKYKLTGTELEIKVEGVILASNPPKPTTIELIRGVTISGINYTISTSKFISIAGFIQTTNNTGYLSEAKAHLIDQIYLSFLADGTYEDAISDFCTALGKTYTLKNPSATFWTNQFLPTGKNFTTNNAQSFLTLLRQKALIFACDNGNEDILFFCGTDIPSEDYAITPESFYYQQIGYIARRRFIARDENGSIRYSGIAGDALHNLGFVHSTDSLPTTTQQEQNIKPYPIAIQLYLQDGDKINFDDDQTHLYPAQIIEIFDPSLKAIPWRIELNQHELFTNTEGGAIPSTIERSAPFTPLNTQNFNNNLDETVNNLQALADAVDNLELGEITQAELDTVEDKIDNHIADTTDAHAASAISYAGGTGISATNVESAIDELATEKADISLFASGTYTPTITNIENITSSVLNKDFNYLKVGNMVIVSGSIQAQHDGSGNGKIGISLPIASNLSTDSYDVNGNATSPSNQYGNASIIADGTNDRAILFIDQNVTGNNFWRILFMYIIR